MLAQLQNPPGPRALGEKGRHAGGVGKVKRKSDASNPRTRARSLPCPVLPIYKTHANNAHGVGKRRLTAVSAQDFIFVLLFIKCCITDSIGNARSRHECVQCWPAGSESARPATRLAARSPSLLGAPTSEAFSGQVHPGQSALGVLSPHRVGNKLLRGTTSRLARGSGALSLP